MTKNKTISLNQSLRIINNARKKFPKSSGTEFFKKYIEKLEKCVDDGMQRQNANDEDISYKANFILVGVLPDFVDGKLDWKNI